MRLLEDEARRAREESPAEPEGPPLPGEGGAGRPIIGAEKVEAGS